MLPGIKPLLFWSSLDLYLFGKARIWWSSIVMCIDNLAIGEAFQKSVILLESKCPLLLFESFLIDTFCCCLLCFDFSVALFDLSSIRCLLVICPCLPWIFVCRRSCNKNCDLLESKPWFLLRLSAVGALLLAGCWTIYPNIKTSVGE